MLELRAEDPRLIGPYRLVGRLGSGGMGKVFLGRSVAGRLVAVKVIRDDLAEDGPRVVDFGISRTADTGTVTGTGLTVGSPGFMSPEQAEGGEVGPASDVFSLGTVLAFAAVGEGPFGTGSAAALVYRVVHSPPDLDRVPARVRPLIERCLAKDAQQRPSPGELLAGLGGIGIWAGWLPAPLMRDLPQPPAWLTSVAEAEDLPSRPATEVAAVPSPPANEASGTITRTAARHPQASPYGAEHDPPKPPRVAEAMGLSTPVKIRRRRSPALGVIMAAILLAVIGFGAYLLIPGGHGPRPVGGPSHGASPLARTKPHRSASPAPATVDMVIKVTVHQNSWVELTYSAGSQIYEGIVQAGTSMTWTESQAVLLLLGNPSGVVLTVNGKRQSIDTSNPVTLTLSPQSSG